jgi:membrane protein DedA with SNARE-associated domain/membrane-associated phospholipid phosphatase
MLTRVAEAVTTFAQAHPGWAVALVFLIAFAEAIAVVGLFVPGTPILLAVGALTVMSGAPIWPVLAAGVLGAVLGDELSFAIGRRYRDRLDATWPFSRHPAWLGRSREFFLAHGAKSVAIGRFLPVVRPMIPLVAGAMGMRPLVFHVVNVTSALVWAPVYLLGGALLGAVAAVSGAWNSRAFLSLVVLAIVAASIAFASRLLWTKGAPVARTLRTRWLSQANGRAVLWARAVRFLLDPEEGPRRSLAFASLLLVCALAAVSWLVAVVKGAGGTLPADAAAANFVQGLRTPLVDSAMRWATVLGEWTVVTGVTAVLAAWLWFRDARRLAAALAGAMAVTAIAVPVVKAILQVARPTELYAGADAYSFPSGHATSAAALYGLMGWMVARAAPFRFRLYVVLAASFLAASVALSRVYLRAHWPSDVLGGLLFALGMIAAVSIAFRTVDQQTVAPFPLAGVAAVALAVCVATFGPAAYRSGLGRYVLDPPPVVVSEVELVDGRVPLPPRRIDLEGRQEESFTLLWARAPEAFVVQALNTGWRVSTPLSVRSTPLLLDPTTPLAEIPTAPVLHDGRPARTTLVKIVSADQRLVARLWPSGSYLPGTPPRDVLIGSVVLETRRRPRGFLALTEAHDERSLTPADLSFAALPPSAATREPSTAFR